MANVVDEFSILQTIQARLAQQSGDLACVGATLDNDAFYDEASRLVLTTDLLVEGQHFRQSTHTPADVGWKAAAVNLSDLAAMGAKPLWLLVSLGLPGDVTQVAVDEFYAGMQALLAQTGGCIIGGDTVGAPQWVINVTAVGQLPAGHAVGLRTSAQPGDLIITTGPHGLSGVGFAALESRLNAFEQCKLRHTRPQPRVEQGLALSGEFSRYALLDSSDGLADACWRLAKGGNVSLVLDADAGLTPATAHPEVVAFANAQKCTLEDLILYGGEDFELVATVPSLPKSSSTASACWKPIGRVMEGPAEVLLQAAAGRVPVTRERIFNHFAASNARQLPLLTVLGKEADGA